MSNEKFLDKIQGCWYGKCLGGAAGAPYEGIKALLAVEDFTEKLNPDLPNDDLDLQLLWLDVLERKGPEITSVDLADAWIEKCWYPFSEYGYFMKNYMRGVEPPYSGILNNRFFKEGMGCPIRSEIWGIFCAGKPEMAVSYAYLDACLDHAENSIYAEQFLVAVEAMAFYEDDLEKLIVKGMEYIPKESRLSQAFVYVLDCFHKGKSWTEVRERILQRFGHPDFTNVIQNLAFIVIALLYGKGDMRETINIALCCGYDTDCTCASSAAIVGIIKGYEALGELKELINDRFVCGINVKRPSDSIRRLSEDSMKLALSVPEEIKLFPKYWTKEGWKENLCKIEPVKWDFYGPYFKQLEQPMDPQYPSPHGEGCVLPDIVCMVNNEVSLETAYEKGEKTCVIEAYEDYIEIDQTITMEGQYACYLETTVWSPKEQRIWAIIGNSDGFALSVNDQEILKKDEIRLWTPYNNLCFVDLKEGENEIALKLLKRTKTLDFSIGFRTYDGNHWHRSKWCTDLRYY